MDGTKLEFFADAVAAQEITISLLLNALFKHHPELTAEFLAGLNHVLATSPIPSKGARKRLQDLRDAVHANQPTPGSAH